MRKPTKKELRKMPERPWIETSRLYGQVLIVPAGTKCEICGYPDDVSLIADYILMGNGGSFAKVRMDCWCPQGVLQYHGRGKFKVSEGLSSQDIIFNGS